MITVRLKGGLGNQMFQYAFALAYDTINNTGFQLDLRYLNDRTPRPNVVFRKYDLDIFRVKPRIYHKDKYRFGLYPVYVFESLQKRLVKGPYSKTTRKYLELSFKFNPELFTLPDGTYFDGYFQCYKYFDSIREKLLEHFSFLHSLQENSFTLLNEIRESNSICLNVRRGDFVTNKLLGTTDPEYYNSAVSFMKERHPDATIYVFSDEIDWCRSNLKFNLPTVFVSHDHAGPRFRDYFELMINCKNFIIPNSSFAWWAAYLCQYPEKTIIAPKVWFNGQPQRSQDIIPQTWVKM